MASISAVIPTYNRGALVERAVRSVLSQTLPPSEVIVVDDGSKDDTAERIRSFGSSVRYVRQKNQGASVARNTGVGAATKDWIAFLDSDDEWFPDHLQRMSDVIERTGGRAGFYFSDLLRDMGSRQTSKWEECGFAAAPPYTLVEDGTDWVMMEYQPTMLQTSVIRRTLYLELGGLWDRLWVAEDTHFFMKAGIGRPVCAVSGFGGRQSWDDAMENRLTAPFGAALRKKLLNKSLLFDDILKGYPQLPEKHREALRRHCAHAHWQLAKVSFHERAVTDGLKWIGGAILRDPFMLPSLVLKKLSGAPDTSPVSPGRN